MHSEQWITALYLFQQAIAEADHLKHMEFCKETPDAGGVGYIRRDDTQIQTNNPNRHAKTWSRKEAICVTTNPKQ